jgi:sec-independent protein translocase protein TatA
MEIVLILAVLVLLFGAKKLPELARGSGRALRIFKAETKGLTSDDEEDNAGTPQRELQARTETGTAAQPPVQPPVQAHTEPEPEVRGRNTTE